MINTAQTVAQLADMTDEQLQKYAAMHKNDPYLLPLALSESARRKRIRQSEALKMAGQQQPKVVDQAVAGMSPAPQLSQIPAGVPQLQAPNIETMADGGIAGYAGGGNTFDATPYLQDPNVQRFLAYINASEGSPKPNQMFGYRQFDDMSRHPSKYFRIRKPQRRPDGTLDKGPKTSAAGMYQIIKDTWEGQAKKQGLQDFSIENQQRAAIGILKDTGALNDIVKGDFERAKRKAGTQWASLKGSTIGAATGQYGGKTAAAGNPIAERYLMAAATPSTQVAQSGTREAPRTPEMLALQQAARRRRAITEMLPFGAAQAGETPAATPAARVPATRPAPAAQPAPAAPLTPAALAIGKKLAEEKKNSAEMLPPPPVFQDPSEAIRNRLLQEQPANSPAPNPGQLAFLRSSFAGPPGQVDEQLLREYYERNKPAQARSVPSVSEEKPKKKKEPRQLGSPTEGMRLPTGKEVVGAGVAGADFLWNALPFTAGELSYGGARMLGIPEEKALGARVAAQDFMSPFGRATGLAETPQYKEAPSEKLVQWVSGHLDKSAEWLSENAEKTTGIPLSKNDASNIQNLLLAGVPIPKISRKGAPFKPVEEAPAVKQAAAAAAKAPRELTPFEKQMRAGAEQGLAKLQQGSPLKAAIDQARATEAGRKEFSIAPETEAFKRGEPAPRPEVGPQQLEMFPRERVPEQLELFPELAKREPSPFPVTAEANVLNAAAKERLRLEAEARAKADAAKAAKAAPEEAIKPEEAVRRVEESLMPERPVAFPIRPLIDQARKRAAQEDVGDLSLYKPGVSEDSISEAKPPTPLSPAEVVGKKDTATGTATDTATGTETSTAAKKKGFDFSDEDWLMMGLNMLQAPAGQTGSALQQLGANIGRSGLATLGAKREREERELDRLYKTVYADYYKGLTKQLGQGDTKMQMVKRIMDEQSIPFSKALELYNQYEYAPKMEGMLQKTWMNPQLQMLIEMGIIDREGLGFTPKGAQLFGNAGYNIPAHALPQGVKVFKE